MYTNPFPEQNTNPDHETNLKTNPNPKKIVILNRKEYKINDKMMSRQFDRWKQVSSHQFAKDLHILEDSAFDFFTYKLSICLCSGLLLPDFFISKCFSCFCFVYRLFLQQGLCKIH